jgi:PHP family Zn ribbon phosphoesterase
VWWLSFSDAYHRNLRIGTEYVHLYVQGKITFAMVRILKVEFRTLNEGIKPFLGKYFS